MKIFKPDTVSLLHKTFEAGKNTYLSLTAILYFPFDELRGLFTEAELWKSTGQFLPKGIHLTLLMPKSVGDVFVIGKYFSPGAVPVPAGKVNLKIGGIDKTLYIFGKRRWKSYMGAHLISDPEPFTIMDISSENAFGGEGFALNTQGKGYYPPEQGKAGEKELLLPNIEDPRHLIASPQDTPAPAGYFPLSSAHPRWQKKAGTYDDKWLKENWPYFAVDAAADYFNTAPRDQRLPGYFHGDERFEIQGMHPSKAVLAAALPRLALRCFAVREGGQKKVCEEIKFNIDTLWLFPDKERGILVCHGVTATADDEVSDLSHLFLAVETMDQQHSAEAYQEEFAGLIRKEEESEVPGKQASQEPDKPASAGAVALGDRPAAGQAAVAADEIGASPSPEEIATKQAEADYEKALADLKREFAKVGIDLDKYAETAPSPAPRPAFASLSQAEASFTEEMKGLEALLSQHGLAKHTLPVPSPPPTPEEASALIYRIIASIEKTFAPHDPLKESLLELARDLEKLGMPKPPPMAITGEITAPQPEMASAESNLNVETIVERYKKGERDFSGLNLEGLDFTGLSMPGVDFRRTNCDRCIFSGARLEGSNFSGASARQADYNKANLAGTMFTEADLAGANLEEANLTGSVLTRALLDSVRAIKTDFSNADLGSAVVVKATLTEAVFRGAKAAGADFSGADLDGASFEKAELSQTDFSRSQIKGAGFQDASADNPEFTATEATGAVFTGVRFNGADFSDAVLHGADFSRATLFQASFYACQGEKVRFTGAELKNSRADKKTAFPKSDFSQAVFAKSFWGGADLRECVFRNANLDEANFMGADLSGADFHAASAKGAVFNKANLARATMVRVNLLYATLRRAKLEQTDFMNANLYGADFFRASFHQTNIKGANTKQTLIDLKMV